MPIHTHAHPHNTDAGCAARGARGSARAAREYGGRGKRCREGKSKDMLCHKSSPHVPSLCQHSVKHASPAVAHVSRVPHWPGKEHAPSLPSHAQAPPEQQQQQTAGGRGGVPLREQCTTCRRFGFFLSSGGGDGGGSTPAQRVPAALLSLLYASSLFQLVSKVFP